MSKTNTERNKMLDARYGDGGVYTPPATVYCGLFSAMPTVSTAGTEITGGGYARVAKTNNLANFPDAVNGQKSNGTAITFPAASADHPDVVGFGWFDAASGGNLLDFSPLTTTKQYKTGDVPEFGVGQMVFNET